MNITSKVINDISDYDLAKIIEENKEIQFYAYESGIKWRDSRFRHSMDEFNNQTGLNLQDIENIFRNHINNLTKEFLEKTKDKLHRKYIGEFNKPESYFVELNYLNIALSEFDKANN